MSVVLGIVAALGFLMICGGSAIDEPMSKDARLHLGLGIFVITIVLAPIVACLL